MPKTPKVQDFDDLADLPDDGMGSWGEDDSNQDGGGSVEKEKEDFSNLTLEQRRQKVREVKRMETHECQPLLNTPPICTSPQDPC